MADERRWKRYRRPGDPRDEDGVPTTPRTSLRDPAAKKPAVAKRPAAKKPAAGRPDAAARTRGRGWAVAGAVVAVVGVVALVAALAGGGDGGRAKNEVRTEVLHEDFVVAALQHAGEAAPGQQPIGLRFDEYGLSVEYYDPNTEIVRTVETAQYDPDGYRVSTRKNEYDDFHPGRFPLDLADPAALVAQVRGALERAEGAWAWRLEIQVDPETRDVVMTTDVSADEDVETSEVLRPADGDADPPASTAPTAGATP